MAPGAKNDLIGPGPVITKVYRFFTLVDGILQFVTCRFLSYTCILIYVPYMPTVKSKAIFILI